MAIIHYLPHAEGERRDAHKIIHCTRRAREGEVRRGCCVVLRRSGNCCSCAGVHQQRSAWRGASGGESIGALWLDCILHNNSTASHYFITSSLHPFLPLVPHLPIHPLRSTRVSRLSRHVGCSRFNIWWVYPHLPPAVMTRISLRSPVVVVLAFAQRSTSFVLWSSPGAAPGAFTPYPRGQHPRSTSMAPGLTERIGSTAVVGVRWGHSRGACEHRHVVIEEVEPKRESQHTCTKIFDCRLHDVRSGCQRRFEIMVLRCLDSNARIVDQH